MSTVALLASRRARRRSLWLLALVVAAALLALVVRLTPPPPKPAPPRDAPAQLVRTPKRVPLEERDRRAINRLLARFVPAAVDRRDPGAAWRLTTAEMRGGAPRAEWEGGDLPVLPYPVLGRRFDQWHLVYSYPGEVGIELILRPRPRARVGPIAFSVDFKRTRGRWLVDSFVPSATYAPEGDTARVVAVPDVTPAQAAPSRTHEPRLERVWVLVPVALLLLPVLALLAIPLVKAAQRRRLES